MMAIEPAEFRHVLSHWATGVTITTTVTANGEPRGLTASAVASVSLEPPLVLVCVEHSADTYAALRESRIFAINFLSSEMQSVSRRFAEGDAAEKFRGVRFRSGATGAPILDGALAYVECRVHALHEGGDHTIFVGEVVAAGAGEGEPLLYYRGRYGRLAQ